MISMLRNSVPDFPSSCVTLRIFARGVGDTPLVSAESGAAEVARLVQEPGGMAESEIAERYEVLHARAVRERVQKRQGA